MCHQNAFYCHCIGKGAEAQGDQVMCPVFHRKPVVTGNKFPPSSLVDKLMKGNLIKGVGHSGCGSFYGFMMSVRGVEENYRLE